MKRVLRSLVAVAAVVGLVVLGAQLLGDGGSGGSEDGAPSSSRTGSATSDRDLGGVPDPPSDTPDEGMYVLSEVDADGLVEVQTWVRSPQPVSELDLTTTDPDLAPGTVESLDLVVRSQSGRVLARRDTIGTNPQTVELRAPATELYLTYTIDGAIDDASETVEGRFLVRVLGMDVGYDGKAGTVRRIVTAPGTVLNVACLRPSDNFDANPRPCGAASTDGAWTVDLTGRDLDDRLLAQVEQ